MIGSWKLGKGDPFDSIGVADFGKRYLSRQTVHSVIGNDGNVHESSLQFEGSGYNIGIGILFFVSLSVSTRLGYFARTLLTDFSLGCLTPSNPFALASTQVPGTSGWFPCPYSIST